MNMLNSMVMSLAFFFKPEISVLGKFGPETQNFLFAMKDKT